MGIIIISLLFMMTAPAGIPARELADGSPLVVSPGDAYVKFVPGEEVFHLYLKAKDGLGSVLITEATADPEKKADTFAFRTWDYHPENGDEKRILNGEFLESERDLFFLVDSTPEPNAILGRAFHIRIPLVLTYGYPWSREGQVEVRRGTWMNIRTFGKPYADYSGGWTDNPFVLSMEELPPPVTETAAPERRRERPESTSVTDIEQAVERIDGILARSGGNIDVVLVVDTTVSMKNDVGFIQESLVPLVRNRVAGFEFFRVGLVLYRDYKEAYLTKSWPFSENLADLQAALDRIRVSGGRDLEEAVNEGIYAALIEFDWQAPERIVIQVGDAPAHKEPQGEITRQMVEDEASRLGVSIYPIRLPDDAGSGDS